MMFDQNMLGRRIKKCRTDKGLTQTQLAEQAGIVYWTVCQLETGKLNPSIRILVKIDQALDAGLDYLVYGEE